MNIGIRVKFDFQIPFTTTDIEVLMELSANHYDGKCQAASKIGGFIYGWNNATRFGIPLDGERTLTATFHELDLSMKIMENSDLLTKGKPEWAASVSKMRKAFIGAVR